MRCKTSWQLPLLITALLAISCLATFDSQAHASTADSKPLLEAHFLDVGQGDCIVIRLPQGETILIDGGESRYGQFIVEYIRGLGVERIDYLIATHPHADHIGGLPDVIAAFPMGTVMMPRTTHTTETYERLLMAIRDKGLRITEAVAGVQLLFEHDLLTGQIIAPKAGRHANLNDYSVVLRLEYGSTAFLFAGDAEEKSEERMLSSGQPLKADVLKIGHHGSSTSSSAEFIAAVKPSIAIIQVGAGNRYDHPAPEVLDRLEATGAVAYRTDLHGTIILHSNGESIRVETSERESDISSSSPHAPPADPDTDASQENESGPVPAEADADIVYITPHGKSFHRQDCRTIRDQSTALNREDATGQDYDACGVCKP